MVNNLNKLKRKWQKLEDEYVEIFCEKHGYDIKGKDPWVKRNCYGGVLDINDMMIGFSDIKCDIDKRIPADKFEKWYNKSIDLYEMTNQHYMSYERYCDGEPDIWSDEALDKVRDAMESVYEAKAMLQRVIRETNEYYNE